MNDCHNLSVEQKQKIAIANRANPYADIVPYELGFGMPKIHYNGFFPQQGECIIYVSPAQTFKDRNQIVGYSGSSAGASVRVAKGLTVRSGGSKGRAIRDTVRGYSDGDLIITSKRIIFIGKDDSFEFKIEKVSAVKVLDVNSFVIQSGRTSKNLSFDTLITPYALGFIRYVQSETATGNDFLNISRSIFTAEQEQLCQNIYSECMQMAIPKQTKNRQKGCMGAVIKILGIFVVIMLAVTVFTTILPSITDKQDTPTVSDYSTMELLNLQNHPQIFDTQASVKEFYSQVPDDRIYIIEIADKAKIERSMESTFDDDVLLYLIQHSTDEDFIGTIEINLFEQTITIDECLSLVANYLPTDFLDYYNNDSSYIQKTDQMNIYTQSFRLNDAGVEFHNDRANQYSYYYNFKIYEYLDGKNWRIETGYSAYGDKDKGWIEKYTEHWETDISNYINLEN